MSDNPKFFRLLESLVEATSQGRLEWHDTVDENTFRVLLDDAIVRVGKQFDDTANYTYYDATLVDKRGNTVAYEASNPSKDSRAQTLIPELFDLAKKNATKVDELLDRLIASVQHGNRKAVGQKS